MTFSRPGRRARRRQKRYFDRVRLDRLHGRTRLAPALLVLSFAAGCATVAAVDNAGEEGCGERLEAATADILTEQGEEVGTADALAAQTRMALASGVLGPRPFAISSPSGTDYGFFVEKDAAQCTLHLYARQKGFVSYTNNLTYIESRSLDGCRCSG